MNKEKETPEVGLYQELMDYCDSVEEGDIISLTCNSFLRDEYVSPENQDICLSMRVARQEGNFRDVDICASASRVDWENPYLDYSSHIPVVLEIKYKLSPAGDYEIDKMEASLMEDDAAVELYQAVRTFDSRFTNFKTQAQAKIEEKGYYVTNQYNPDNLKELIGNRLVLREARMLSYSVEDDLTLLNFEVKIDGELHDLTVVAEEEFDIISYSPEGFLPLPEAGVEDLEVDSVYTLYLSAVDQDFFTEDFVEEQLVGNFSRIRESFLLESIIVYEEE